MKIALVVPGGVDRSGRERVVPVLLWLIERLARRHSVHVVVLDYYAEPCDYGLLGAAVHDVGRATGSPGLRPGRRARGVHGVGRGRGPPGRRRVRLARRLSRTLAKQGPFDVVQAYWGMPAGVVAASVGRRLGVPVVATLSSGELVRFDDIRYGL